MVLHFCRTRRLFSLMNLLFFSVIVVFLLYLAKWSPLMGQTNWLTYYVLATFELLVTAASFLPEKGPVSERKSFFVVNLKIKKFVIRWSVFLLTCVLLGSVIENLYLSHSLLPFLSKIDTHVEAMPIVGSLVRASTPVAYIIFYLDYKQTHSKTLLAYCIFVALYLALGSGSRYWFLANAGIFFFFWLFSSRMDLEKMSLRAFGITLAVVFVLSGIVVAMGQFRIGSLNYSDLVQYNGPLAGSTIGEFFAWFYGYFPYSYENLNLSLANIFNGGFYTSGQAFFVPFNAFLKIYKFLPVSSETLLSQMRLSPNGSATVPTAFLYFFSDFGFFFFLTPSFYIFIYWFSKTRDTVLGYGIASSMAMVFLFFSFNDLFQNGVLLEFWLILFICQLLFIRSKPSFVLARGRITI
jgi:hypothetical protein